MRRYMISKTHTCCVFLAMPVLLILLSIEAALGEPTFLAPRSLTSEMPALGAKLFNDPRLSKHGTLSCASCHDPNQAFTNPSPPVRDPKIADERLRRDVPSLLDVAAASPLHHDGREPSLEVQILAPLFNPAEMANDTFAELEARLESMPDYRDAFQALFASKPTVDFLGKALAAYERTLIAGPAPFDLWQSQGSSDAVSPPAKAGFDTFIGKGGCAACHVPGAFTDHAFKNTGVGFESEQRRAAKTPEAPADRGREEVTHLREDRYKFRTPTLRNVELTAPYMHDGSLKRLEDVIDYYDRGGSADTEKDGRIRPLGLTEEEKKQLVAFLKSLTSKELPGARPGTERP